MPGNSEEKEKCMEKLTQMEKFIPFLDFMIDKINKKNCELSLECQLSKFQLLRSMIAEKNGKYTWDIIVKVEDVIKKLITKLDYKDSKNLLQKELWDRFEDKNKSKNCKTQLKVEGTENKINKVAAVSISSSTTTTISISSASNSPSTTTVDSNVQDSTANTVDLVMKTLKMSVDSRNVKNTDNEQGKEFLSNSLGSNQSAESKTEAPHKMIETDLDKDLEGFKLPDCSNFTGGVSSSSIIDKISTQEDLLSSSREKLLQSLQKKLYPTKIDRSNIQTSAENKTEKGSDSQTISAFSSNKNQTYLSERKIKSVNLEGEVKNDNSTVEKQISHSGDSNQGNSKIFHLTQPKAFYVDSNVSGATGDLVSKQKLREKLSADICEVYRVSGKSVGGSLRFLKEHKKPKPYFDDELFKPDKITEMHNSSSSSSYSSRQSINKYNSFRNSSKTNYDKIEEKRNTFGHYDRKRDEKRRGRNESTEYENNKSGRNSQGKKLESGKNSEDRKKLKQRLKKEEKSRRFDLNKLNDNELLEFVKENTQSLPHLSKLKPSELRKAVNSSLFSNSMLPSDLENLSNDSFDDLDDFMNNLDDCSNRVNNVGTESIQSEKEESFNVAKASDSETNNKFVEEALKVKNTDMDSTNRLEDSNDTTDYEECARKLIEESTSQSHPAQKKKGLLELPLPWSEVKFKDISSADSPDYSSSVRDPRKKKSLISNSVVNRNISFGGRPLPTQDSTHIWPSPSSQYISNVSKDSNQSSLRYFSGFGTPNLSSDTHAGKIQNSRKEGIQEDENVDVRHSQMMHLFQYNNRYPVDPRDSRFRNSVHNLNVFANTAYNTEVQRQYFNYPPEPKSYAEYKKMKLKENKLAEPRATSNAYVNLVNTPEASRPLPEKDSIEKNSLINALDQPITKESNSDQKNSKTYVKNRTYHDKKTLSDSRRPVFTKNKSREESRGRRGSYGDSKKTEDEKRKKIANEKRHSSESEELISPLEKLYHAEDKPKTGRGYGLQNFKIPKKVREQPYKNSGKSNENASKDNRESSHNEFSKSNETTNCRETKSEKESLNSYEVAGFENKVSVKEKSEEEGSEKKSGGNALSKTETNGKEKKTKKLELENRKNFEVEVQTVNKDKDSSNKMVSNKNELENSNEINSEKFENKEKKPTSNESLAESSQSSDQLKENSESARIGNDAIENSKLNSEASKEKSTVVSKEEITQEFVEALIRKSFQSGEGKLLLAQAKLFEEFTRKLNSKKLKTIQKIINSESDSSSTTSESSSEDERKKKKSKDSTKDKKSKKRKKKTKKNKKQSSSSESDESDSDEMNNKKEENQTLENDSAKVKTSEDLETTKNIETGGGRSPSIELPDNKNESLTISKTGSKTKKRRKALDFGKCISRKKTRRKQGQKKLLEEILKETPQSEISSEITAGEIQGKECEQKNKPKPKTKIKTELDRLHDDIRNMFICSGVVTATGQRMCRILKESGGNMNNLDIVKESAKMVEEEKLKKVGTRSSSRLPRKVKQTIKKSRSRSQSSEKNSTRESSRSASHNENLEESLQNEGIISDVESDFQNILKKQPYVLLHKVDLDNFGYGVKISDNCLSFSRLQGRNTAIRGRSLTNKQFLKPPLPMHSPRVYLMRNLRKIERLKNKTATKRYVRKKIMDIVKNLPLKMATMKHLKIIEKAENEEKKKKLLKKKRHGGHAGDNLLNYAFCKNRTLYSCRLCSKVLVSITSHYKSMHPESEVLISRLSKSEAKKAIADSSAKGYSDIDLDGSNTIEMIKRRMKSKLDGSVSYCCRMCSCGKFTDSYAFFIHVSGHTGEYRYKCSVEDCSVTMQTRENLKAHILSKHPKNRYNLYNSIVELYPVPIEYGNLFGFICSLCHFVQICRNNIESHIRNYHSNSKTVKIIKIDMSSKDEKIIKGKKSKTPSTDSTDPVENNGENTKNVIETEWENINDDVQCFEVEKKFINNDSEDVIVDVENVKQKSDEAHSVNPPEEKKEDNSKNSLAENYKEDNMDFKNISNITEIETVESVQICDKKETAQSTMDENATERQTKINKLKVGPLEAQLLENHESLYECYIKDCSFLTKVFDLFEKHIKISHSTIKWDGVCETCPNKFEAKSGNSKFLRLEYALKHLKCHERVIKKKVSVESLTEEMTEVSSSEGQVFNDESKEAGSLFEDSEIEVTEKENKLILNNENIDTSHPTKPLLRVRNLLGDRLSTPKDSPETETNISVNEEVTNVEPSTELKTETSKMFTIENVRSLKQDQDSEDSEIQIENVKVQKETPRKQKLKVLRKPVLIRPCPSPKIAIRPETTTIPIEVGQIKVLKTPDPSHSVVLSPISKNSPVRIITYLTPGTTAKCTVNPNFANSKAAPISKNPTSALAVPDCQSKAPTTPVAEEGAKSGATSPNHIKINKSESNIDEDDTEQKEGGLQKVHTKPNAGNKSVKDAEVYKEMLTKTKLCHLFKCMAFECSFTCNNESVFTQHIGLHEAQRRVKRQRKGLKNFNLDNGNKSKKVFNWQQCAYCCEVLVNTSSALSQHVITEHGHCIYQCAYCFYRAVSQSYVEIHQNLAHGQILKKGSRIIYKCKPLSGIPSATTALEKQGRRQSVRPYHCDQCGSKFFITQEFMNHLTTEHQSVTAYTCHICKNLCFKADRLIVHYKLHSYCTYQCAYCLHGTETEKEMVFHLCNFHFSQPAFMYVRALAEGQSDDGLKRSNKKKKTTDNQLDSLKVIVYESDSLNPDCIVDADPEEEVEKDESKSEVMTAEISSIVAELGIETENKSSGSMSPLIKELATISSKNPKSLCVKSILPNAEFSSENESGTDNGAVLISSGLSSTSHIEKDIPLGQLPLETVNICTKEPLELSSSNISSPDKNLKINEILMNLHHKDKTHGSLNKEEEKNESGVIKFSGVHKLPQMVISRMGCPKNVYPAKNVTGVKKNEDEKTLKSEEFEELSVSSSDKNLKINEILVNIQNKEKSHMLNKEEDKSECAPAKVSAAVHKMPAIVLSRKGCPKNVYPAKMVNVLKKKPEEIFEKKEITENGSISILYDKLTNDPKLSDSENAIQAEKGKEPENTLDKNQETESNNETSQPLITNVVSLSSKKYEKSNSFVDAGEKNSSIIISDVCSLSLITPDQNKSLNKSQSQLNIDEKIGSFLKPALIRAEDYSDEEEKSPKEQKSEESSLLPNEKCDEKNEKNVDEELVGSPEVIILEEGKGLKDILTVVIDSEDEKEAEDPLKTDAIEVEKEIAPTSDDTIRKEMELLRDQIASETNCLLFDEPEVEKSAQEFVLPNPLPKQVAVETKSFLSPVKKALSTLHKKVQSENNEKKSENIKVPQSINKVETDLPRTRSGIRRKFTESEGVECVEKSDSDDSNLTDGTSEVKKEEGNKVKKFKDGLVGKDLYICGNEKCKFAAADDSQLKDHLYVCDFFRESSILICPHCPKKIRQLNPYIEHIKHHGEKKFYCGLCTFISASDASVIRHLKQKHKCSYHKTVPKEPRKEGHLLFYPKNYKTEKQDFEENGYSPGDEDKLPLQSVYQINVKCAKCPYFTKVRSNMVRHLKIHLKSSETEGGVVVPSTAPTNPVPCLDTKEKMFDKMTNLAASSQLAKDKTAVDSLPPEEESKLPQFVPEQMRYKCCLPDCNYITVDDGMLKHHIKALHDEISYYSCPHCRANVHVDVRHVTLDKIGHHLKHHDAKLYKCAHCIYFHFLKSVVEKHTMEKHPDRRYFVYTVREPKSETSVEKERHQTPEAATTTAWKCGICNEFQSTTRMAVMDHLTKKHNTKSKYKCQLCFKKSNYYQSFFSHFQFKHPGEKVECIPTVVKVTGTPQELQPCSSSVVDSSNDHFDTTPLWQRGAPRIRHIRGILIEEEEVKTKRSKRVSADSEKEPQISEAVTTGNAFYCPLCSDKRKVFYTRNAECFRSHLYQELNYQQFACILCGKMFVDKKDFDRHHAKMHPDKSPSMKQTKEDGEIMFWVDKVIAKQWEQIQNKKRRLSEDSSSDGQVLMKKKKEV